MARTNGEGGQGELDFSAPPKTTDASFNVYTPRIENGALVAQRAALSQALVVANDTAPMLMNTPLAGEQQADAVLIDPQAEHERRLAEIPTRVEAFKKVVTRFTINPTTPVAMSFARDTLQEEFDAISDAIASLPKYIQCQWRQEADGTWSLGLSTKSLKPLPAGGYSIH